MEKIIFLTLITFFGFLSNAYSQQKKFLENIYSFIEDPGLFSINQSLPHVPLVPFVKQEDAIENNWNNSPGYRSLNGLWKFKWLETPDLAPKDFFLEKYKDQTWDNITVPGNWEMQGFGDPMFRNVSQPFRSNPPYVPHDYNTTGCYRKTFTVPGNWDGK